MGKSVGFKPSHEGGEVKRVGKYYIEMVYSPISAEDPLTFYLLKRNGKPLSDTSFTGAGEIVFQDGSKESFVLKSDGFGGYVAHLNNRMSFSSCSVTFKVKNKDVAANFYRKNTDTKCALKTIFTCSMHPDITVEKPGNCAKCGMTLTKSK